MADDYSFKQNDGTAKTIRATDVGSGKLAAWKADAGALNLATGQVTAGAAATLVIARPTRKRVTITNTDGSNAVYIGPATVTSGNGFKLAAGATVVLTWVGLIQVLAAAGSPLVCVADEYF
jgi:hypothetical protein